MERRYEVAISGISGYFPECESVEEFQKNLFNKVDFITVDDRRWPPGMNGVPAPSGKIKDIDYFDTSFFGIHRKLCENMDCLVKLPIERAYESIIDAGVNPTELNGTDTAVLIASCISEYELVGAYDTGSFGFGILGVNKSMQANRISYALNLKGPSFSMDSSWNGGIQALQHAFDLIADGHCKAAIVGVTNLLMHPDLSLQYLSMGKLNYSSTTKSFTDDADGYARAEASVVFFLQRAEDAKRSYGTILKASSMYNGDRDISLLSFKTDKFKSFLENTYDEAGVDPASIAFLEADGCGIKSLDAMELNAAAQVMCNNREDPLLIGSVKSNMGHAEGSSSFVSIVKGIIALEEDCIPPNLHYSTPNTSVPELLTGKMKVVTEATPLPGNLIGITSLGLTGGMAHVIIKQNPKKKNKLLSAGDNVSETLPRLFIASARDENGIIKILDKVSHMPFDEEFISLTHNVWNKDIMGHLYRGYSILPSRDPPLNESLPVSGGKQSPVWFIFSGMGSQWTGMGTQLLRLPIFRASIQKCQDVLKPKGIDVFEIITSEDPEIFHNILNSFVGIAAIQIGLTDILSALGIKPDGIVGHSVGELGCAYADGCFTAEQMILSAYLRGRASIETPLIKGMMAAVGLGYKQMKEENLPESIDVACHNAVDSCTLSGPDKDMEQYISQLKERRIFAKLVNVSDIAYHSRYIANAGPVLFNYLKDVIPVPKPRSERWISSSIPESEWGTELARYSSAEYFTNNLLSPVLFEEACNYIPQDAITIEIAPHCLLQAILRRSLKEGCKNIALTQRTHKDGLTYLLSNIGKLYLNGLLPDVKNIYPEVEFPVSRRTAPLHNLVSWDHTEKWDFKGLRKRFGTIPGEKLIEINLNEDLWLMYLDHNISNHCILPASAFLIFAWELLMYIERKTHFKDPVIFEDVRINDLVEVTTKSSLKIFMSLQRGSGRWEVTIGSKIIASGIIRKADDTEELSDNSLDYNKNESDVCYEGTDIYRMFEDYNLMHKESFRTIRQLHTNNEGFYGSVTFNNNWVQFLEGILKMHVFMEVERTNQLHFPTFIHKIIIDPSKFTSGSVVEITNHKITAITAAPGLKMFGVKIENMPLPHFTSNTELRLEEYKFLSYSNLEVKNIDHLLNITAQFLSDNIVKNRKVMETFGIIELKSDMEEFSSVSSLLEHIFKRYSDAEIVHISLQDNFDINTFKLHSNLLIISDYAHVNEAFEILNNKNGFLLVYYSDKETFSPCRHSSTSIVFQKNVNKKNVVLFKKVVEVINKSSPVVDTSHSNWSVDLQRLKSELSSTNSVIYLIIHEEPLSGIHGFIKAMGKSGDNHMIRFVFLLDKDVPPFSLESAFYSQQIRLDLSINVYMNGSWGSFFKIPVKEGINYDAQKGNLTQLHRLKSRDVNINFLGLNLKSLAITEEGYIHESKIGPLEYSGANHETGEQIIGLAGIEPGAVDLNPDPVLHWAKPFVWTLEDAATVPLAYTLAYYALIEKGRLQTKEKVLLHCGYTPLGQAVISIARKKECEIFITYFTSEQAQIIKTLFPDITDDKLIILDNNFDIKLMTGVKGAGVDVLVNCFSGTTSYFRNSLECLGYNGRFLHLGQSIKDISSSFGMLTFLKSTSFYGINSETLFNLSEEVKMKLKTHVQQGIEDGTVKPFNKVIYSGSYTDKEAKELIRCFGLSNPGKKLIHCIKSENSEKFKKVASNKFLCHPDKSYVVIGGKSALWLDIVSWLCERGGRKFIIGIENESMSSTITRRFRIIMSQFSSCRIDLVAKNSIKSLKAAENFLSRSVSFGPIDGIFFVNVSDSSKINFCDIASRNLATSVSMFVSILSNGNLVCENRRLDGLSGITIDWDKVSLHSSEMVSALDDILNNNEQKNFILSEQNSFTNAEQNKSIHISNYIPESVKELANYGQEIGNTCFIEVQTLSPPYKDLKDVSPVFIIPGFKPNQLDKLISRLVYPAFKAKLPVNVCSIDEAATYLIQAIKCFSKLEAFTLIGVGWGGMIALKMGSILEAENKVMTIILLDSEPHAVQRWASDVQEDMNAQLLDRYFSNDSQDGSEMIDKTEWEDCLKVVRKQEKFYDSIIDLEISLTALRNRLLAILNYNLKNINVLKNSLLYLYKPVDSARFLTNLGNFSQNGEVIFSNEVDFQCMVESSDTIQSLNDNLLFYYPDIEFLREHLKLVKDDIKKRRQINNINV